MKPVLIIDDEADIRELLDITISRMGIDTLTAGSVNQALEMLNVKDCALVLTDMKLPDGNGLDIIAHIQKQQPQTPVAMITAYGSMETAVQALKAGAFDFISKPVDIHQLRALVSNAIQLDNTAPNAHSKEATSTDHKEADSATKQSSILGQSAAIQSLNKKIVKLARSQAPVFIHGESGSGKELVARNIHLQGPRAAHPFIAVNCGAIPEGLMESEFFGHKKGAFTGATGDKQGFFQAANGGTLFLDEVADLPLDMQVKLLRAIQEKAVRSVGAHNEETVDVRILSATHKNLSEQIQQQKFREDLYYRINVIELQVPALRERSDDILLLAESLLARLADTYQMPSAGLDKLAKKALLSYEFPGNVRELENILERAYTLCDEDTIYAEDLDFGDVPVKPSSNTPKRMDSRPCDMPLEEYLENIEREELEHALEQTRWNKTEAAKLVGMSFRSIRYRLKKLGID
jgi:two-component system, NtrC family, response regulator PilR